MSFLSVSQFVFETRISDSKIHVRTFFLPDPMKYEVGGDYLTLSLVNQKRLLRFSARWMKSKLHSVYLLR